MNVVVLMMLLYSAVALAEQPRGRYTLDRGAKTAMTDPQGTPYPSCGDERILGGQATFVVEYRNTITVNGRAWRFHQYASRPKAKPRPDAAVIIKDPLAKREIYIWFRADRRHASGVLHISGTRCSDAWELIGTFDP